MIDSKSHSSVDKPAMHEDSAVHTEVIQDDTIRRGSIGSEMHTEAPVWDMRRTYTHSGIRGILSSKYVFMCALFATLGGLLFGYDQGVVSITLVMPQFLEDIPEIAEGNPGAGFKKGLMTAVLELGAFLGAMNQGWIADKISRKWSILVAGIVFLVGAALQTGAVNYGMLTAARAIGGVGVGM